MARTNCLIAESAVTLLDTRLDSWVAPGVFPPPGLWPT